MVRIHTANSTYLVDGPDTDATIVALSGTFAGHTVVGAQILTAAVGTPLEVYRDGTAILRTTPITQIVSVEA